MNSLTLDAGALIALERHDSVIRSALRRAADEDLDVHIPAGVLAQVWRDHPRQHALHVLLGRDHVNVAAMDLRAALAAGALCAAMSSRDVVDASVVICARGHASVVVTSDPKDIAALDPELELVVV